MNYGLNKPSKNVTSNEVRIRKQAANFLEAYDKSLKESVDALEQAKHDALIKGASTYSMAYQRNKERIKLLEDTVMYQNNASIVGMTTVLTKIVESALLFDIDELEAQEPGAKDRIHEIITSTVKDLLEHGDINENITNKDTLAIMEAVFTKIPEVSVGVSLTEDDLARVINDGMAESADEAIKNLSGDVSKRVAVLMEKEQKRVKELAESKAKAGVPADAEQPVEGEEVPQEEVPAEGEEEMPAEEGEEMPAEGGEEVPAEGEEYSEEPAGSPMPKKQIQMLPDGTLNVNIYEEYLSEAADSALVKQSQMANGWSWTKQGRYDPEMLTAKGLGAIKSTLGLTLATLVIGGIPGEIRRNNNLERINSDQYKELRDYCHKDPKCAAIIKKIKAELMEDHPSGKVLKGLKQEFFAALKEAKAKFKETELAESMDYLLTEMALEERDAADVRDDFVRETPRSGLFESLAVNEAQDDLAAGREYNPDSCLARAIAYVTITEAFGATGLMTVNDETYAKIIEASGGSLSESMAGRKRMKDLLKQEKIRHDNEVSKIKMQYKSGILGESVLASQHVPSLNRAAATDLAERIRAKRLNEEENVTTSLTEEAPIVSEEAEVLDEGVKTSLSRFFLRILPEKALDKILIKVRAKIAVEEKAEKYVSQIDKLLKKHGKEAKLAKREWINKIMGDAKEAEKRLAEKKLEKVNKEQVQKAAALTEQEELTEGTAATKTTGAVMTGAGSAAALGLGAMAIGAGVAGAPGALGVAMGETAIGVVIAIIVTLVVSGIATLIAGFVDED